MLVMLLTSAAAVALAETAHSHHKQNGKKMEEYNRKVAGEDFFCKCPGCLEAMGYKKE